MKSVNPEEVGFDPERLDRIVAAIDADIAAERSDGAAVAVGRRGHLALVSHRGFADRAARRKLDAGSVFATMSVGKQFANVVVLNRIERGDLRLTTRVCDVIPEFGRLGKERMNLFHLLTHTSGITSRIPEVGPETLTAIAGMVGFACAQVPESLPGQRVTYSILVAHALMAEMVRRVDGSTRSFAKILEEDLFRPLGMNETSLGPRDDLTPRLNPIVARFGGEGLFAPEMIEGFGALFGIPGAEVPAGGYLTTLADLSRFSEMLRRGGELDGHRILSPAMLVYAAQNHTGDQPNALFDYTVDFRGWNPFPASIGIGFFVRGEGVNPGPFGHLNSPNAFGGVGAGSTAFWIDPVHDVTFSFLSTGLMEDSRHIERVARLSDIVISAIVE